jgi:hypothetical protein
MQMLRDAGVKIQHYFHLRNLTCWKRVNNATGSWCEFPNGEVTRKNRCCNSLQNISKIVNAALKYFPQDSFFQDNGPWTVPAPDSSVNTLEALHAYEWAAYNLTQRSTLMSTTSTSADTLNGQENTSERGPVMTYRPVMSNGHFDAWALAHLNESIIFESSVPQLRKIPASARQLYPRSKFAALIAGVADAVEMRKWVDKHIAAGYGSMCMLQLMTPGKQRGGGVTSCHCMGETWCCFLLGLAVLSDSIIPFSSREHYPLPARCIYAICRHVLSPTPPQAMCTTSCRPTGKKRSPI